MKNEWSSQVISNILIALVIIIVVMVFGLVYLISSGIIFAGSGYGPAGSLYRMGYGMMGGYYPTGYNMMPGGC